MTHSATREAASSALSSIGAPAKAAGDTVAALGSVIDTATERGRKARRQAGKRARAEIEHQRRVLHKQAKDAKKKSRRA